MVRALTSPMLYMKKDWLGLLAAGALVGACAFDAVHNGGAGLEESPPVEEQPPPPAEDCTVLTFDTDPTGADIPRGSVLQEAYASLGIQIRAWDDKRQQRPGLAVAFDSDNPTGGDDDLSFVDLGNILINQEDFNEHDVAAGKVSDPDDNARGAQFEFLFDQPMCVKSLTLLDLDFGEDPAEIRLYADDGRLVTEHLVDPMGNNTRLDVALPNQSCEVTRATVLISSSGALDNVEVCKESPMEPVLWTQIFNGGDDDVNHDVAADSVDNPITVGSSFNGVNMDALIRKYDPDGNFVRNIVFDNGNDDEGHGVAIDSNDNIIITGMSTNDEGDEDAFVSKFTTDGVNLWTMVFDGGADDVAYGVAVDGDDNVVITGFTTIFSDRVLFVRKYSPAGGDLWTQTFTSGGTDTGFGVDINTHNEILVAGTIDNGDDSDVWLRKYDTAGVEVWTHIFDGGGDDGARSVVVDHCDTITIAGFAFNGTDKDIFVRQFDDAGATLWTQTFDGDGADVAMDITSDAARNVIITGSSFAGTLDAITRKFDTNGRTLWTRVFNRGNADQGNGVATDRAGNVLSTGYFDNGSNLDIWLVKYRP